MKSLIQNLGVMAPLVLLPFSQTVSAVNYVASIIEFGEQVQAVNSADLNGDTLNDLIVSNWNEDFGRELWIYWQQAGGKFPAKPSQRIEVKRDIIAYAIADIRAEPGEELVFFTAMSVFSYSANHDSYAGNLQKLSDWEFVNAVPSRRSTPLLSHFNKVDSNGYLKMLIPGRETYAVLSTGPTIEGATLSQLPKAQHRRQQADDDEGGVSVGFQDGFTVEVTRPSYLNGLLVERLQGKQESDEENDFARYEDQGLLLNLERWINNVTAAQLIPGPDAEYIFFDEDPELEIDIDKDDIQRLNIVAVDDSGTAKIAAQYPFNKGDDVQLFDFNDDGLMDLLATKRQGSDANVANIYLNKEGKFALDTADQVLKVNGSDVRFQVSDVNGDSHSDLIVGAYQISPLQTMRGGALTRVSLIFKGSGAINNNTEQTIFSKRPDFKLEESFSVDDIKGLTAAVDYTLDIDNDGNKDAVAVDKRGALTARTMQSDFRLDSDPLWEFVPSHFIQQVDNQTLNDDNRPDFVLRHQNGITVLVSQ